LARKLKGWHLAAHFSPSIELWAAPTHNMSLMIHRKKGPAAMERSSDHPADHDFGGLGLFSRRDLLRVGSLSIAATTAAAHLPLWQDWASSLSAGPVG